MLFTCLICPLKSSFIYFYAKAKYKRCLLKYIRILYECCRVFLVKASNMRFMELFLGCVKHCSTTGFS